MPASDSQNDADANAGNVVYCSTEQEYYQALEDAGQKLVVIDVFAEWFVWWCGCRFPF
jgi:thiol:disulfide interchange protein